MQKNQLLILATAITAILTLLVVAAVYFLVNSNTSGVPSMMGGTSTTNNWLIPLILIVTASILAMAIVLYFVYPKNKKNENPLGDIECANREKLPPNKKTQTPSTKTNPFDIFLCYKKSSGKDYADHLKAGLEELGLHTFEDCKDIPQTVDTQEGWAMFRDKALEQSRFFVLIMTPGFDLSSEVIKEIGMARKQTNKTFVFFRHRSMARNIVINLGDEVLDIGKLEQVSFESKEELLRLAHSILLKAKSP